MSNNIKFSLFLLPRCFLFTRRHVFSGISAFSITADISKSEDVHRMIDTIVSKWGAIHIACNNAGINMNSASEDTSLEEWDQTFNVNLRGAFMCCQVCNVRVCDCDCL